MRDSIFSQNLATEAHITASNIRGNDQNFAPTLLTDGNRETCWSTDDDEHTPSVVLTFNKPVTFNVIRLQEYLPLGQRIDGWAIDADWNGSWQQIASGTPIGSRRIVKTAPQTTSKVHLRVTGAPVCPALAEVGLYFDGVSDEWENSRLR